MPSGILKPPREMSRLFRDAPQAIRETQHFLDRCNFSLEELRKTEYADETREGYATPHEALVAFCEDGVKKRFPQGMIGGNTKHSRWRIEIG